MKSLIYTLLVSLIALTQTNAEKVMRPIFKEVKLWSNEKFVTHNIAIDMNDPHINFTFNAVQQLHNVDLHIEVNVLQKLNADYFLTINTTINLCNILDYVSKSALGSLFSGLLKEYGHIIEKCPIAKGFYYMNKLWIPEDSALANVPEVDFDVKISSYHLDARKKKTLIIDDLFSGEVVVHDVANVKVGILGLLPKPIAA